MAISVGDKRIFHAFACTVRTFALPAMEKSLPQISGFHHELGITSLTASWGQIPRQLATLLRQK
jgi:hypothetical protein